MPTEPQPRHKLFCCCCSASTLISLCVSSSIPPQEKRKIEFLKKLGLVPKKFGRKKKEMPLVQVSQLQYSDKYADEEFEYRHIQLPKELSKHIPRTHLMTETEWRNLGIAQSPGWVHYMIHAPEPHVLMFRRPLPKGENKENDQASAEEKNQEEDG